jgi:deoxyribonuclease-1
MPLRTFFLLLALILFPPAGESSSSARDGKYFKVLPLFWSQLYGDGGETLYCGKRFSPQNTRGLNVEHVFPMSWVMKELGCRTRDRCRRSNQRFNDIEADMQNLYPAIAEINKARSAMAYGMVLGEKRRFGNCDFEVDPLRRRVEPRRAVRGNIARAMFYMQQQYGLKIYPAQGRLLLQWHRQDPPDAEERRRNDLIERLQGHRNRFIDDPGYADRLHF